MERRDEVIYIPSVLVYVSISWLTISGKWNHNEASRNLDASHLFRRDFMFGSTVHIIVHNGPDAFCRCVGQRSLPEETDRNIAHMNAIWH